MRAKIRQLFCLLAIIIITLAIGAAAINVYMVWGTKGRIVVLGCAVRPNKEASPMLNDRMQTAISFYKEASVTKMLVSGDNLNEDYDEVSVMKKLAVSGGIEEDEVYMDHTGLNTYDTIVHSLEFFNKGSTIVIVTQSYHLYRAIYLAQRMGLNAYGVSADSDIVYRGQLYREFREMAARLKDFWYGITKPELPKRAKGIITCKSKKFDVYYA